MDCFRTITVSKKTTRKTKGRTMQFIYARTAAELIRYTLITDPPEAMYWSTYRLKKSDVKLLDKFDRSTAANIKQEIFDDIIKTESIVS